MTEMVLSIADIQKIVKPLAQKYNISEVYIFGSYARSEATSGSDIDFLVFGGKEFKPTNVFAFAEELRMIIKKEIDGIKKFSNGDYAEQEMERVCNNILTVLHQ